MGDNVTPILLLVAAMCSSSSSLVSVLGGGGAAFAFWRSKQASAEEGEGEAPSAEEGEGEAPSAEEGEGEASAEEGEGEAPSASPKPSSPVRAPVQLIRNVIKKPMRAIKKAFRPSAIKKAFRPSAIKKVFRPSAIKKAFRPSAIKKAFRPSAIKKVFRPSAIKKAFRPSAIKKAFKVKKIRWCFSPETPIKLQNGETVLIKNLKLGDILINGSIVTATMQIRNENDPYYRIDDILVTGSHHIESNGKFIRVSEFKDSVCTDKVGDVVNCLITSDHKIPVGNYIFWDWEDQKL